MPKMPVLSARKLEQILKKKGFSPVRQSGNHRTYTNNQTGKTSVVPIHSGDIAIGTLKSILRQTGLTIEDLT